MECQTTSRRKSRVSAQSIGINPVRRRLDQASKSLRRNETKWAWSSYLDENLFLATVFSFRFLSALHFLFVASSVYRSHSCCYSCSAVSYLLHRPTSSLAKMRRARRVCERCELESRSIDYSSFLVPSMRISAGPEALCDCKEAFSRTLPMLQIKTKISRANDWNAGTFHFSSLASEALERRVLQADIDQAYEEVRNREQVV